MLAKAILIGRIGKKELKPLKKGGEMVSISLATNRRYKDAAGEKHEVTTWHQVSFFSKLADVVMKYTNVGDLIYIEGEIQNLKIETENGPTKWMYSVTGQEIKLLPNKKQAHEPITCGPQKASEDDELPF